MASQPNPAATYVRKNQEPPLSLRGYILQGSVWLGVMLALFYAAGLRF